MLWYLDWKFRDTNNRSFKLRDSVQEWKELSELYTSAAVSLSLFLNLLMLVGKSSNSIRPPKNCLSILLGYNRLGLGVCHEMTPENRRTCHAPGCAVITTPVRLDVGCDFFKTVRFYYAPLDRRNRQWHARDYSVESTCTFKTSPSVLSSRLPPIYTNMMHRESTQIIRSLGCVLDARVYHLDCGTGCAKFDVALITSTPTCF